LARAERASRPSRVAVPELQPDGSTHNEEYEGSEFDYEKDLHIDPNYLDAEFLNHSSVFMRYGKESAGANKALKLAEEKVKTIRSQVIKALKESGDKFTETTLEAAYRLDPDYLVAKQEYIEASYDADLLINAVYAFQARKVALENLVRLHGQQYFSTPNEPRDLPEAAKRLKELKEKSTETRIRERMKR
jgi:hypothetical protein